MHHFRVVILDVLSVNSEYTVYRELVIEFMSTCNIYTYAHIYDDDDPEKEAKIEFSCVPLSLVTCFFKRCALPHSIRSR